VTVIKQKWLLTVLASIWLFSIVIGLFILAKHENTPGIATTPPVIWPADSNLMRSEKLPTLIMFGHPHCPCTRASIGELALLMARCQGKLEARVLFIKPAGMPDNWEKTDLWQSAQIIPGVSVQTDSNGVEANRFQALTSGQTVLYDTNGRLLFQGGITMSRGHSGDNAGRSAITEIVNRTAVVDADIDRGKVEKVSTAVFGCSLCRTDKSDNVDSKIEGEGRE
jgi:hypothetical protein